jgi:hypothetical protein
MEVKIDLDYLGKISLQNIILDLVCELDDLRFNELDDLRSNYESSVLEIEKLNKQNFDLVDICGALRAEIQQLKLKQDEVIK